ncbi:MAG: TRAP transporter large permease [Proteobacteria bacterium]|nr:MAG: TRAP transporter large permease [Pseudomonadota bacterium]QKK11755.1 MAG: TRAP transporter large permease [Pseudomonadota bacterium]
MSEAFIAFAGMLGLIALRVPIAFAMGIVGYIGYGLVVGWEPALKMATTATYETGLSYSLSVVPLFILMGNFVSRAGLSDELYQASNAFLGHRRGGLAMATVVACGGFSAVCGSSLATAATMSKVAYPPMRRFGYSDALATGSIAAGGTLGILIPPSVILVIYGILTESDIGKLFIAGVVPGILGVMLYLVAVMITVRLNPKSGPPGIRTGWHERLIALRGVWGVVVLFVLVIGGIYGGVFTPTEAAGIGASGSFLFALARRRLTLRGIFDVLVESVRTTSMIFFVLIGALMFSNYINITSLPTGLVEWVTSLDVSPLIVVVLIMGVYVILGCVLESLSMILLTVPVFYPVMVGLDFGDFMDPEMVLIWFGIVIVVVTEISLITPPVGLNVFVLRSVLPEVKLSTIFRGVTPFWCMDIVRLMLLVFIPPLSLYLPSLMG